MIEVEKHNINPGQYHYSSLSFLVLDHRQNCWLFFQSILNHTRAIKTNESGGGHRAEETVLFQADKASLLATSVSHDSHNLPPSGSSISLHCSVNVMTYVGNRYQHARGQSESVGLVHQPSSNAGSSWELVHCPLPKQRPRGLWGQSVHQCGRAVTLELSPGWLGIINYGYLSLVCGHELRLYVLFCSVMLNPWHFSPKKYSSMN